MADRHLHASPRVGSGTWARHGGNIDAWKRRALLDVMPLTLEFAPIVSCNMRCPGCPNPYRVARRQASRGYLQLRQHAALDDESAASRATATCVLERAAEAGVLGVLWTGGGEPSLYELLFEMLRYSADLGMVNCLYTNGVEIGFDADFAARLLDPALALVFARVSINAISPLAMRKHWGIRDPEPVVDAQLRGLGSLLRAREALTQSAHAGGTLPSIQVSTIINDDNADDLETICDTVAGVFAAQPACRGAEDVIVVRPMIDHDGGPYAIDDRYEPSVRRIIDVCGRRGAARPVMAAARLPMFVGFGLEHVECGAAPNYAAVLQREYATRDYAWANGVFLTVGPAGSVHLCTEHNCDPAWSIGNLQSESVHAIYHSERRQAMLAAVHEARLGPTVMEPNTRASRLDRIARAIYTGELGDADIQEINRAAASDPPLLLS